VDDDALVLGGRANAAEGDEDPDDAASSLRGRTTPADLRLQLELLTAYLVDPGFRPESEAMARRQLVPFYDWLATDPSGPLRIQVPRILASGDHRFGVPPREEAMARTLAELREWLRPQLSSGPLELALVGDFDTEAAIEAAAATIGALPPRSEKPALEKLRVVRSPEPGDHPLHVESGVAKAELALFWPTTDARDIHRTRRLGLLAAIFSDRLRKTVREELGGSYSPYALSSPHDTYLDYGFIQARVALDPAVLERVRPALLAVAKDLARNGVTEDELDRAKRPVLTAIRESFRDNEYWLINVLGNAQERPERLDWARHRERDFQSITKAELDTLAATYLAPERAIRFTVLAGPPTSAVAP
jgi:zinc protease